MELHRDRSRVPEYMNNFRPATIKNSFSVAMLDTICRYAISESEYIRKAHLMNLREAVNLISYDSYQNDPNMVDRYRFIRYALEARLDRDLKSKELVIDYIESQFDEPINFVDYSREVSFSDIKYISEAITDIINYGYVGNEVERIDKVLLEFKNAQLDGRGRGPALNNLINVLDDVRSNIRKHKIDMDTDITFSLRGDNYKNSIDAAYKTMTSPRRRLLTGMQGLNEMTGGGFENGRCYMLFGMTAGGKSVTLLNLADQIRTVNNQYIPRDRTKTPCIVILTMENSVIETIARYYNIVTGGLDMRNAGSTEEAMKQLYEHGLKLTDDYPIDVIVKYKPNRSVTTRYLYELRDELENDNYEMICLIQDHVKRICSESHEKDIRLELGEVVNQFKSFAIDSDIPVITVSHLNRNGASVIEDNMMNGNRNKDITKQLGKSTVGESFLMLDNLDGGYLINKMEVGDQNYMAFRTLKKREGNTLDYFAQPFVGDTLKLVEDINGEPAYKVSLNNLDTPIDVNNPEYMQQKALATQRAIQAKNGGLFDMLNKMKQNDNMLEETSKKKVDKNADLEEIAIPSGNTPVSPFSEFVKPSDIRNPFWEIKSA